MKVWHIALMSTLLTTAVIWLYSLNYLQSRDECLAAGYSAFDCKMMLRN